MQNAFGGKVKKSAGNSNWLKNGEIVDVILLQRVPINRFKKILDEANTAEKEKADSLGLPFEPKKYSFKNEGIAWDYAIVARSKDGVDPIHKVLSFEGDKILDPGIKYTGRLEQSSMPRLKEFPNSKCIKGGIETFNENGNVRIERLLPNPYPEKDWSSGIRVDELTDENREFHIDLIEAEELRQAEWKDLLEAYNQLDEEAALDALETHMAQVYLMGAEQEDKTFQYIRPQKGMMIRAKLKIEKEKYMKLIPFEWRATESQVALADSILVLKEESYQKYLEKQKDLPTAQDIKDAENEDRAF